MAEEEIPFEIIDTQYRDAKERRPDGKYNVTYRTDTYNDGTINEFIDSESKIESLEEKIISLKTRIIELENR